MSRLTKRNAMLKASCKKNGTYYCLLEDDCEICDYNNKILDKLAHYEDLADEGRLIELPCKIGDKVYCLNYTRWKENGKYKYKESWVRESFLRLEHIPYFGKTVFLTKAEAEAKLAELKEGGSDE